MTAAPISRDTSGLDLHPAEALARSAAQARDAELAHEPERRRAHGVVHTPPEIARGVLAITDELLRVELELERGASDPRLHVIDPACGPGAFLAAALRLWEARERPEGWRATGLDVDPAALERARGLVPYAPTQLELHPGDVLRTTELRRIGEAARAERRALAIVGNPPWAAARSSKTGPMQELLEDFRRDGSGARLDERKLGVLSDAYVRFFRACAELARNAEHGAVLALVTNGSFLDGPVHRGMRGALLRWFDALYVLDLGGSALLQRTAAQRAERDDNVFGVRPSVAISWLCRRPGPGERAGRLAYARLRGCADDKLRRLGSVVTRAELGFTPVEPHAPWVRFAPARATDPRYASWPSLADWMPFHREGIQTNRDAVCVDTDPDRLRARLRAFARGEPLPELAQANIGSPHYDVESARRKIAAALERDPEGRLGVSVRRIAYRPFDDRWFCPVAPLCHRPRPELLQAIDHEPSVLVATRKDRGFSAYSHFGIADRAIDNCYLSARSSCRARAFPARTPDAESNLDAALARLCAERVGRPIGAAEFQRYALAILASRVYRTRFDAELHADYPRIPPPSSRESWEFLCTRGEQIVAAWLEPRPVTGQAPELPAGVRVRELRIDAAYGCIEVRGRVVFRADPAVLEWHIGHHAPTHGLLRARAAEPLDSSVWQALLDRLWRVTKLHGIIQGLDAWVLESGHV